VVLHIQTKIMICLKRIFIENIKYIPIIYRVWWYKTFIRSSLLCEPVSLRVVMRLVHATDKTWYTVLYHHTTHVINLSNISIKTNFKQIAKVELKCVQYSEGDYLLCMTSRCFFCSFTNVKLLCFVSHSNDMTSCQSSSTENVSCNIAPFCYHHSVVIQHLVSDTLYQTGDFR
jgi:hypothetical protein